MSETDLQTIENRMASGEPFTFSDLWVPVTNGDHHHPSYRLADRTLQKWRRAGRVEMRPGQTRGSSPLWFYLPTSPTTTQKGE